MRRFSPRAMVLMYAICSACIFFDALTGSSQDLKTGLEQLAEKIVTSISETKTLRVAVADFPDLSNITSNLGRYIANRLTTRFAQSQKFFVVERQRLEQVLQELRFSMSDLVDPEKAKKLGNLVGVDAILVGTISDLGNQVDIDARIIEIETSRTILSATTTISKDQTVAQLMEQSRTAPIVAAVPAHTANVSISPQPAATPATDASNGFHNAFLSVRQRSISKAASKKSVNLVLQFENLTNEALFVALMRNSASLLDDKGNVFSIQKVSGIGVSGSGYTRQKESFTLMTPQAPYTVVMVFQSNEASDGTEFSFSADCYRYEEESTVTFSVGIANMRLP